MENVGTTTTEEKVIPSMNGWAMVGVSILAIIMGLFFVYAGIWGNDSSWSTAAIGLFLAIAGLFNWNGVFTLEPNTSTVFTFVGEYKGTVRDVGIRYINPFFSGQEVSLRSFSSEIERVKVNDANGNPIEISGVFVAEIQDTARAEFDVDDFEDYLNTQAGMALRDVSAAYPFESNDSDGDDDKEDITLKGNPKEVGDALVAELQKRLDRAGAKVLEAGLGHCAYAPEIAEAMPAKTTSCCHCRRSKRNRRRRSWYR